jgi:hypothetical protein
MTWRACALGWGATTAVFALASILIWVAGYAPLAWHLSNGLAYGVCSAVNSTAVVSNDGQYVCAHTTLVWPPNVGVGCRVLPAVDISVACFHKAVDAEAYAAALVQRDCAVDLPTCQVIASWQTTDDMLALGISFAVITFVLILVTVAAISGLCHLPNSEQDCCCRAGGNW